MEPLTPPHEPTSASPSRLGKSMIYAAWLIVLALLTWLFTDWLEAQRNPNQNLQTVTQATVVQVDLLRNRYGHYHASGEINDQPVEFMLDTGATVVSIPQNLAQRLGLQAGVAMLAQTANGTVTTYATRLARVRLGPIVLHDVRAHINPGLEDEQVLLGMSFLKQLEFSQRGDVLTLRQLETQ